ncbi:MAG TPA: hypothetical protein VL179_04305, partial [Mycobacterium sp.]|nr:hypothetical protein [Mycobacterium sp.]
FVVAFAVPKGAVVDALYWDTPDPYHYVRLQVVPHQKQALQEGGAHPNGWAPLSFWATAAHTAAQSKPAALAR